MPEIAGSGKPTVFASSAARHCANRSPGPIAAAKSTSRGGEPSAPLSLASCALVTSTLLLGSMTAMTTTTAATSCMPPGATWQHTDGGVGLAIGVPVGVGVAIGVGLGHAQILVSHGVSLN